MRTTLHLLLTLSFFQTLVNGRASVMVIPNSSQFFEYENILVSCNSSSSWEWTPWRNDTDLVKCGSGWGKLNGSTCEITSVKLSEGGVFWCQSKYGDSSNGVNISIVGGPVSLQSPAVPVTEGDNVTLICRKRKADNLPVEFFKDGLKINVSIDAEDAGHMTLYNFTKSNQGAYKCRVQNKGESPESWIIMEDGSDPASLVISPASAQVFEYRNLSLSCGVNSSVEGWRIFRSTITTFSTSATGVRTVNPGGKTSGCGDNWGNITSCGCNIYTSKQADTAIYWCETPVKQRSNSLNVSVQETAVILESPILAVMKGHNVTLMCKTKDRDDLRADFYKDGSFLKTGAAGHMTLHQISNDDEGVYKCNISNEGESATNFLFVRGATAATAATATRTDWVWLVLTVLRHLVVFSPYCASTFLVVSIYRGNPPGRRKDDEATDGQDDDVTTEHDF
ncbi:hypothetical protein OYC64_001233 [Pagothenia borchgrevinki]|uniref:Ig-like domain-containing protein n=1 Tax=Pagothenia borchgrevinki TaxID=8213 RepID=A0ABD2G9W9_PAGBO